MSSAARPAAASLSVVLAIVVAACGVGDGPIPDAERKPLEQSFAPPYAVDPPSGGLIWISGATLDAAHEVLTVEFVGGAGYHDRDGCSEDYVGWVGGSPEAPEVAIVRVDHLRLAPRACLSVGYGYTFHLRLPAPFDGAEVRDRGGGTLLVGERDDTATLAVLPAGWSLQHSASDGTNVPPVWTQVFAAEAVAGPLWGGPGRLVLYQQFGMNPDWLELPVLKSEGRGGHRISMNLAGEPVDVWADEEGELMLAWTDERRGYQLFGNASDMTPEDLVRYAESLSLPDK